MGFSLALTVALNDLMIFTSVPGSIGPAGGLYYGNSRALRRIAEVNFDQRLGRAHHDFSSPPDEIQRTAEIQVSFEYQIRHVQLPVI